MALLLAQCAMTRTAPASGGGGSVTPLVSFDPSNYANITALLSDSTTLWTSEAVNTSRLALDTSVFMSGTTKSLRYDWPNNGTVCIDYRITPGQIKVPNGKTELWWRRYIGFGTGWTTNAGAGCSAPEYKCGSFGDLTTPGATGRGNDPEMQASQLAGGYPGNDASFASRIGSNLAPSGGTAINLPVAPSTWWGDGLVHEFQTHYKLSQSNAGIFRFVVDGTLYWQQTGMNTDPTNVQINSIGLGLNMNQGPSQTQSHWVYRVDIYDQDPGWGI